MTTLTIDLQDDNAVQRGITLLQRFLGNASAPAAAGQRTATAGAAPASTASAKAPAAASAAAPSQASTAATDDGKNATASAGPTAAASTASSNTAGASPAVAFDELKKAFLGLSTKANGRALCEGVLKPLALAKLSDAKPEQYAALLDSIKKAAA